MKLDYIIVGIFLFVGSFIAREYYSQRATIWDVMEREISSETGILSSNYIIYLPLISTILFWLGIGCFLYGLVTSEEKYRSFHTEYYN